MAGVVVHMKLSEIEDKIAAGDMSAAQVFTHMKQHIRACANCVPTNWLDSLLSGRKRVLKGKPGTWSCPEIEELLLRVKARIEKQLKE